MQRNDANQGGRMPGILVGTEKGSWRSAFRALVARGPNLRFRFSSHQPCAGTAAPATIAPSTRRYGRVER